MSHSEWNLFKKQRTYSLPISQDGSEVYPQAQKNKAFYLEDKMSKIIIYGTKALELINHFSVRKIEKSQLNSCYTLFFKGKSFLGEAVILKLSPMRYLICYYDAPKLLRVLRKARKKYQLTTVDNATEKFDIFSFHGDKVNDFFSKNKTQHLFKVVFQNYSHLFLLCEKSKSTEVKYHYTKNDFLEIHLETKMLFLYNNNVITNLHKIKNRIRSNILRLLCPYDNYSYRGKERFLSIYRFELSDDVIISKDDKIYNQQRKKIGFVQATYKVPNKKNPFFIGIVKRFEVGKFALLKVDKHEVVAKKIINY